MVAKFVSIELQAWLFLVMYSHFRTLFCACDFVMTRITLCHELRLNLLNAQGTLDSGS